MKPSIQDVLLDCIEIILKELTQHTIINFCHLKKVRPASISIVTKTTPSLTKML